MLPVILCSLILSRRIVVNVLMALGKHALVNILQALAEAHVGSDYLFLSCS